MIFEVMAVCTLVDGYECFVEPWVHSDFTREDPCTQKVSACACFSSDNSVRLDWNLYPLFLNTLLSAHAEMRDCSPMRCWRAPHFCVFLHDVQRAFSSWSDTLIASRSSSATCRMFGSQVTSRQTALEPYFRTISLQNVMGMNIKSV